MKKKSLIIISILIVLFCAGAIYWYFNKTSSSGTISSEKTAPAAAVRIKTTGTISVEKAVSAADVKIETAGGKVVVEDINSPIAGLEIDIPANSYKEVREFKVSYGSVLKHTFGEYFNPITPLIGIDNGGGYSEEFMQVKIPVKVPADSFAMGFIYDSKTNMLEGLTTISQDDSSITVATRHFTDLIVSMIPNLELKKDIDTGFRPGMDDWQFINRGSYISPGGHCAGQSISAMWYYSTQPDGKDLALYNRYDNNGDKPETPKLWEDDSFGYRFASTIQEDADWNGFAFKLWKRQRGVDDDLTWKLFSYSMQLTGEPQMVGLTKEGAGGHAMVAYRIMDGELYIADPNYPGDLTRRIKYIKEKIEPYESGANFDEIKKGNSTRYDKIGFTGKTTIIDWGKVSERWAEFKNKTIGNDRFPDYAIVRKDKDGKESPLNDGYVSTEKLIDISLKSDLNNFITVSRDEKILKWDADGNLELLPGNNKLGVAVWGELDKKDKYIDFKYINVVYEPKEAGGLEVTGKKGNFNYSITDIRTDAPKDQDVKLELADDGKTAGGKKLIITYVPQPGKKLDNLSLKFVFSGSAEKKQWDVLDTYMSGYVSPDGTPLNEFANKFHEETRQKYSGKLIKDEDTLVDAVTATIETMGGASYSGRLCNKLPLAMGSRVVPQSELENCSNIKNEPIGGGVLSFDLSALANPGAGKKIFDGYISLGYSVNVLVNVNNKAAVKEAEDYNQKYGGGSYVEPEVNEKKAFLANENLSILEVLFKVE